MVRLWQEAHSLLRPHELLRLPVGFSEALQRLCKFPLEDFFFLLETPAYRDLERTLERLRKAKELADEAAEIEQICFPPNEACAPKQMKERIETASDLFLVARDCEKDGKIAGFLNGIATDEYHFKDDFFTNADTHNPNGENIMLLGLDVLPEYRKMGLGRELVYNYCRRKQERGRKRLVLTCLPNKVKMYKKFGFEDLGIADSSWGGEEWHEMIKDISINDAI